MIRTSTAVPARPSTRMAAFIGAAILATAGVANAQLYFNYDNFDPDVDPGNPLSDVTRLSFVGQAAMPAARQLSGNHALTMPGSGRAAGAMWFSERIDITDDFISTFSFVATNLTGAAADGLAFVIQDQSASALGGTGGALGYADNPFFGGNVGITNSLAVEFDTWNNSPANWADGPASHAAIHSRCAISNSADESLALLPGTRVNLPVSPTNGNVHTVRIAYLGGTFSVFYNDLVNPIIVVEELNLADVIAVDDGQAWIGITSAIAAIDQMQMEIIGWSLVLPNIPTPGAFALLGLGGLVAARRRRA